MASLSNFQSSRIVVVGAGAAGLSCAWRLARSGYSVTVVDRGEVGRGALWASGGMLAAGFEASVELDASHELALPFVRLLLAARTRWPEWIGDLQLYASAPLGFNQDGAITPLYGQDDLLRADQVCAQAERLGIEVDRLSPDGLAQLEPRLARADGGLVFAGDGQLDNRALGPALAAAVYAAGGRLEMRQGVTRLHRRSGSIAGVVLNGGQVLEADHVVVATGAAGMGDLSEAVLARPVKGQMLAFNGGAEGVVDHVVRGFSIYLCSKPGGRVIAGATVEPDIDDLSTDEAAIARLKAAALKVVPELAGREVVEQWSGLRPAARDLMPVIGEAEPGLILAGGGYRNGVLLAPVMAEAVSKLIKGKPLDPHEAAFCPTRSGLVARRDH